MKLVVERSRGLSGTVHAPPSKSHTHRAILIASLAKGTSRIKNPLLSDDCQATIDGCRNLGVKVEQGTELVITGVEGIPGAPSSGIDVRSSGTTMRLLTAISALCEGETVLTGDASVRARPMGPLLRSLKELGAKRAESLGGNDLPPVAVAGKMKGGRTVIESSSSQYLSGLLVACPLVESDSVIEAQHVNSRPYVSMTLEHMHRAGVTVGHEKLDKFYIEGGRSYRAGQYTVPGDHSSAAFILAAAFITSSDVRILGLDEKDSQGDRVITDIIRRMGTGAKRVIDMRDIPDLLPVAAVLGCHAEGSTVLKNVGHARHKESNRIAALCMELGKMGAVLEEKPDGLVVSGSRLKGADVDGHGDHRMVMALAVAGLDAEGTTVINDAETLAKSYPGFADDLARLGAKIRKVPD
jgi:3-phosphoshikimate 1-carboxyvinyltransferase